MSSVSQATTSLEVFTEESSHSFGLNPTLLSENEFNKKLSKLSIEKLDDFVDSIPPHIWESVKVRSTLSASVSLLSLVKTLKNLENKHKLKCRSMSDSHLHCILVFGNDGDLKVLIEKIEPYRLPRLMEQMQNCQKEEVISRVSKERMCMIIPLLSLRVLDSCAPPLAIRMSIGQLSALRVEQYALLVPHLDTSQVEEMTKPIRTKRRKLTSFLPSIIGIAFHHKVESKYFTRDVKKLTHLQLERSVPVMDLSELGKMFSQLSTDAQSVVKSVLPYHYRFVQPDLVKEQAFELRQLLSLFSFAAGEFTIYDDLVQLLSNKSSDRALSDSISADTVDLKSSAS